MQYLVDGKRLLSLLKARDAEQLACAVERLTGVSVPPDRFLEACFSAYERAFRVSGYELGCSKDGTLNDSTWDDSTYICWFRNRVNEFLPMDREGQITRDFFTCPLHIGFLCVQETEEQIKLLRHKWENDKTPPEGIARSRISNTLLKIFPIDRVAAWVVSGSGV